MWQEDLRSSEKNSNLPLSNPLEKKPNLPSTSKSLANPIPNPRSLPSKSTQTQHDLRSASSPKDPPPAEKSNLPPQNTPSPPKSQNLTLPSPSSRNARSRKVPLLSPSNKSCKLSSSCSPRRAHLETLPRNTRNRCRQFRGRTLCIRRSLPSSRRFWKLWSSSLMRPKQRWGRRQRWRNIWNLILWRGKRKIQWGMNLLRVETYTNHQKTMLLILEQLLDRANLEDRILRPLLIKCEKI